MSKYKFKNLFLTVLVLLSINSAFGRMKYECRENEPEQTSDAAGSASCGINPSVFCDSYSVWAIDEDGNEKDTGRIFLTSDGCSKCRKILRSKPDSSCLGFR